MDTNKMDLRFSTMFLESPSLVDSNSTETKKAPSKLKKLFGRVFNTPSKYTLASDSSSISSTNSKSTSKSKSSTNEQQTSSSPHTDHLWNTVIKLTKPTPKTISGLPKTKVISTSNPPPKPTGGDKKRHSTTSKSILVLPPSGLSLSNSSIFPVPSYTQKDVFYKGKGKPLQSSRDSKFSSISSLPSIHSSSGSSSSLSGVNTATDTTTTTSPTNSLLALGIESTHLNLSRAEFTTLKSQIRRIKRRLKQQEYVTVNLSTNLLGLLARKECMIQNPSYSYKNPNANVHTKRFRHSTLHTQNQLTQLLILRTQLCRLFARKAAWLNSSLKVVDEFEGVLLEVEKVAGEGIPEVGCSWMAEDVRFWVGKEDVRVFGEGIKRGVEGQRVCDGEIGKVVGEEVWGSGNGRRGVGEKVMMGRFGGFVEGRLGVLGGVYAVLEGLMKGVGEVKGKGLEDLLVD